jgi:hypothetical protein
VHHRAVATGKQWGTVAMWVVLLALIPMKLASHTAPPTFQFVNAGLILVMPLIASVIGELIVLLVARLLGDRVVAIVIGIGPTIFNRGICGVFVRVNLLPLGGSSVVATTREHGQGRRVAIARSISALTLGLIAFAVLPTNSFDGLREALGTRWAPDITLCLATLVVSLLSVCISFAIKDEHLKSWWCLGQAKVTEDAIQRGAYTDAIANGRTALARYPDDALLQLTFASAFGWSASDEALAIFDTLRARPDLQAEYRPLVENNYAWQCYMNGRDDLRFNADLASQFSLSHAPDQAARLDTRGHILLWSKRYAEAEPMLVKAYEGRTPRDHTGRASSAAGLAMLCAATDRPGEAQTWLERARVEGVSNDLIAHATATVEPLSRR